MPRSQLWNAEPNHSTWGLPSTRFGLADTRPGLLGLIWGYGTRVQRNARVARARFSAKMQKQAGF